MKYTGFIFIFLFSLSYSSVNAQYWTPSGGRASGMGSATVAMSDFWSVHNNQAGMAFCKEAAAGIYYENHFMVRELGCQSGAITIPCRYGVFGVNIGYSGDALYNTMNTGLAYALTFGSRFAAGIQLDFLRTHLSENYGNRSMATFEAGILTKITEDLTFGAHVFNPVRTKLEEYNDGRVPSVMNAGLCYTFSDILCITAEAYKNSDLPMEFLSGAEYKFFKNGIIRAGMATNPFRYSFGFGLVLNKLSLDISSTIHETLGYSPQCSLYYTFGK